MTIDALIPSDIQVEAPNLIFLDGLVFCSGVHCRSVLGSYEGHSLLFVNVRRARYSTLTDTMTIVEVPIFANRSFSLQYIINGSYYELPDVQDYGSLFVARDLRILPNVASPQRRLALGNRVVRDNFENRGNRGNRGNRRHRGGPMPRRLANAVGLVDVGAEVDVRSISPVFSISPARSE